MPEQVVGKFVIDGPQDRIDLVKRALDRLDPDVTVDNFIRDQFQVVFGPVDNVPGTNKPAYGYFKGKQRKLLVRHGMGNVGRDLKKAEVQYTFLHEALGHGGEMDGALTNNKRMEIMAGMHVPFDAADPMKAWRRGDAPAGTKARYWRRPYEAYCDLLVAALSDVPALFERRYVWDIAPGRLKEIVTRPAVPDPNPEPIEDPDGIEEEEIQHGECADVQQQLADATADRDDLQDRVTRLRAKLKAAKDKLGDLPELNEDDNV